jgi:small GTP-binding protein
MLKLLSLLYKQPTVGFNVETIKYKNIEFTAWDIGGQDRLRSLWSYYFHNTDALIWVLDANDAERYQESANELQKLMRHPELERSSLLVYANKTDLPGARSVSEIADALGLSSIRGREWYIQSTSAITGEGLYEGLEWVAKSLKNKPSN